MENAYGIGVKNRYELFYNEDVDPLEIIRQQEEEKEKRKSDKTHSKDKSKLCKSGKQITAVPKKAPKETPVTSINKAAESIDKTRTRPFDRTFKTNRSFDESKVVEERKNIRNREDHGTGSETRDRESDAGRGNRGGFRGRGRSRGRGGFFNNFEGRPPRRDLDRHSGSDRMNARHVKRESAGSSNWDDAKTEVSSRKEPDSWMDEEFNGTAVKLESVWRETNEIKVQISRREEMPQEKADELSAENMDSKENEPIPDERTEGMKEMTLDEWKREQEAKRAVPKYNLRKPGEGEDGNQWKKLYMLKKKIKNDDDEDDDEDDEEEDIDDEEFARRGRQRQLVDIQINFNDSRRARGRGRGVRGIGPRSTALASSKDVMRSERRDDVTNIVGRNYGRGGSRSSKSGQQSAPRVDDWNDFPSLVTI